MPSAIASPAIAEARATAAAGASGPGEFAHVAVDDHSRIALAIFPDEKKRSAVTFLHAAVAYYQASASRSIAR